MTAVRADDEDVPADDPTPDEISVAENLLLLVRSFGKARARMLAAAAHDVEWSAQVVLKCLDREGALRSGDLAGHIHADPSTVSRQVASLVRQGLVERRADPADGRASLLVLTDKAAEVLAHHDDLRNRRFAQMLAEWSERDVRRFAQLLARFTADFQAATGTAPDAHEPRRSPAEGTDR